MSALVDKYGEYIVEPGTLLFRRAANKEFHASMFFGFCSVGPGTSNIMSNTVQVWKVTKGIRSLLMLRGQRLTGEEPFLYSAIVDIYNEHFPLDKKHEYDDLMLKKHDTIYRRRIIALLKKQGITSWVCSVEDNYVMELFLFAGAAEHKDSFSFVESYKLFPEYSRKEYPNSFNYDNVKHLPEIRKGTPPHDPWSEWMIHGEVSLPGDSIIEKQGATDITN